MTATLLERHVRLSLTTYLDPLTRESVRVVERRPSTPPTKRD